MRLKEWIQKPLSAFLQSMELGGASTAHDCSTQDWCERLWAKRFLESIGSSFSGRASLPETKNPCDGSPCVMPCRRHRQGVDMAGEGVRGAHAMELFTWE